MVENWVRTDEAEDVAGSIRHALRVIDYVREDPLAWKWFAMALHSALQGACICHLTTTAAPIGAVTDRNASSWLKYFEDSRSNLNAKPPKTYLMTLPDLMKAVRKPYSAGDKSNANGVAISESELVRLCQFHENIRNQFVHFEPMVWSIEVSGMPGIAHLIARIVEEIVQVGWAFRHQTLSQSEDMRVSLKALAQLK